MIEILGKTYKRKEGVQKAPMKFKKLVARASLFLAEERHVTTVKEDVLKDIAYEYKVIQQKASKLSSMDRDFVVRMFNLHFEEVK